jgi:hypothetical protein
MSGASVGSTLIRVAVDLLLEHAGALAGGTEDQLRESVTHRVTGSQTPGLRPYSGLRGHVMYSLPLTMYALDYRVLGVGRTTKAKEHQMSRHWTVQDNIRSRGTDVAVYFENDGTRYGAIVEPSNYWIELYWDSREDRAGWLIQADPGVAKLIDPDGTQHNTTLTGTVEGGDLEWIETD